MFSYRHAFHAGNHADVLKHLILIQLLSYLGQKDTPYWYIDTHAGAGVYALEGEWAGKNAEHEGGIARLWERDDLPPAVAEYVAEVAAWNEDGVLRHYPGSPFIAGPMLRDRDCMRLFEAHPTEITVLQDNVRTLGRHLQRKTMFYDRDGFSGLKGLLPPPTRRGLVLIDPSYEDKRDYIYVMHTMQEALARFATGCYAVWYPQVARHEAQQLPGKLMRLDAKWLHVSLTVRKPSGIGLGLNGSGMFIVNPPWTLAETLKTVMPWLTEALGEDDGATFTLDTHGV